MKKPIFTLIVLILLHFNLFGQSKAEFAKMTPAKWLEDLEFLAREYPKKHRNLFHTVSREQFEKEVNSLKNKLPNISNNEVAVEFAKIGAVIGGGHTEISLTRSVPGFSMFPIQFSAFNGSLFVSAMESKNSKFIGMRLVKIGDTKVEEAFEKAKSIISRDPNNEVEFISSIPRLLVFAEILQGLKIIENVENVVFTFEGKNKEISTLNLNAVEYEKIPSIAFVRFPEGSNLKSPLSSQNPRDNYWQTYLADSKAVYFKYNACRDQNGKPSINEFTTQLFQSIKQNSAKRLIIDLRHNSGGNFHKSEPLISSIVNTPEINQKGKLFVILGRQTYSAAIATAILLKNKTNAIFVGEPPRGSPNFLEDVKSFRLPNSKIEIDYSVGNPDLPKLPIDTVYFPLDMTITPTLEDYLVGEDTILKKLFADLNGKLLK
jgi:hypothetical protein